MPRIFIALATYNGSLYLEKLLQSLLQQSVKADHVIVVDDGSTDNTLTILNEYKESLSMSIFCHEQNKGHCAAFSRALSLISEQAHPEDYIVLADQDDVWLPNKHAVLKEAIGDADLVFGDAEVIDEKEQVIAPSWRELSSISKTQPFLSHIAGINNVTGCLSMFRASLLEFVLPIPNGVSVHDRWIAMHAQKRNGIKSISTPVVKYRLHANNAVGLVSKLNMSQTLKINIEWLKTILTEKKRLGLSSEEGKFTSALLHLQELRVYRNFVPKYLFWVWCNRNILFFNSRSLKEKIKKTFFSIIGLRFAKRFLGKS